jgi:UDP-3-O-[3-hydroxymyristoyl] glucosamine N-acyltransferase LpxD
MRTTTTKIAELLGMIWPGPELEVHGACTLSNPKPGHLAFISKPDLALFQRLNSAADTVFIVTDKTDWNFAPPHIRHPNPRGAFARAATLFEARPEPGIHPTAIVHPSADVHNLAVIGPYCVIGAGSEIGEGTELRNHVTIGQNVRIGRHCLIRSSSIIGEEGFGIDEDDDGNNIRLPHLGGVLIGNHVEIGSLNTVCSGTIEPTRISNHCKLDDHVHIAHNIVMDDNCIICACAEISGGVHLEPGVWVGPNSATVEGLTLAADTLLGVGAVVTRSTEPNGIYAGNPAKRLRDRFANPPITPKAKE